MEKGNQRGIYKFGAAFMLDQVNQLERQIDGALSRQDIEYVHRMRVASRRLRTALELFEQHLPDNTAQIWRGEFKGITKALGQARDLDVQIQWVEQMSTDDLARHYKPGYKRLLLRLKQARKKAQGEVNAAIDTLRENETIKEMHTTLDVSGDVQSPPYSPDLYQKAFESIHLGMQGFLGYRESIYSANNSEPLHAMRIAGKHLRYTLEIFAPLYQGGLAPFIGIMKSIQDRLGEIHDCDVWVVWLPEFINQEKSRIQAYLDHTRPTKRLLPGIQHLIEDRKIARQEEYHAFLDDWQAFTDQQTWKRLKEIVDPSPYFYANTITRKYNHHQESQ